MQILASLYDISQAFLCGDLWGWPMEVHPALCVWGEGGWKWRQLASIVFLFVDACVLDHKKVKGQESELFFCLEDSLDHLYLFMPFHLEENVWSNWYAICI